MTIFSGMRLTALFLSVLALFGLYACAPQDVPPVQNSSTVSLTDRQENDLAWPFWPASMRIHPLSRLVTDPDTGRWILESRIEFFDPDSHTTKAAGEITLQLYTDSSVATATENALKTWNADLTDLTNNRQHYDEITQTYLFRLDLEKGELPARPDLRAFFVSVNGQLMESRREIR